MWRAYRSLLLSVDIAVKNNYREKNLSGWSRQHERKILEMRRQRKTFSEIANVLQKPEREIVFKYLEIAPRSV